MIKFLLPLLLLGLLVWFFFAVAAPARARKRQRQVASKSREAEAELSDKDSRMADGTATSLESTRKAAGKAIEAGEAVRDKLPGDS